MLATSVMGSPSVRGVRPGRRYDNRLVSIMVAMLLATVLYGFARRYFLAGLFRAPLPNALIHIHGAVFASWMILLVVQTSLVSAGRVDIHRKLGLAGFGLACVTVVLGVLAATDAVTRNFSPIPTFDAKTFYAVPLGGMFSFATLIFFAYRTRRNPAVHKRLVLIATIAMMDAAIDRWPIAALQQSHIWTALCWYSMLLLIVLYDLWSTGKVYRATILGSLFLIVVAELRIPIGSSAPWHAFAIWAQSLHI